MSIEMADFLAKASPAVMLALFILLLFRPRGPLVLRRELETCEARIGELKREKDEYKSMALKSITLGERVASVAERNGT